VKDISRCVKHSPLGIPKRIIIIDSWVKTIEEKSQIIQTKMKKKKQHQRLQYPSYKEP
jgi:hypothetical protein